MKAALFACVCLLAGCPDGGGGEYVPDPPPVARPDQITTAEDTAFDLGELVANDDHVESLTFVGTTVAPVHGRIENVYNTSTTRSYLHYVPNPGFYGHDRFTYVGRNDSGDSNEVEVSVKVTTDGIPYEQTVQLDASPGGDVALADLDGDGRNDIVHAEYDTVRVLLTSSTAPGTVEATALRFEGGRSAHAVELADLDGDGLNDIVVAAGSDGVIVMRNRGAAALEFDAPHYLAAGGANDLALVDLDRDGMLDIASVDYDGDALVVRRNTSTPGTLSFGVAYAFAAPEQPTRIAAGDIDRAGGIDLIVTSYSASSLSLFVNAMAVGDQVPAFAARVDRATGTSPRAVVLADLDGDTFGEIAVIHSYELWIYANRSPSGDADGFIAARVLDVPYDANEVVAYDVDGVGPLDLVVGAGWTAPLSMHLNRTPPTGAFEFEEAISEIGQVGLAARADFGSTYGLATGDVDGAARDELVVTGSRGTFVVFE